MNQVIRNFSCVSINSPRFHANASATLVMLLITPYPRVSDLIWTKLGDISAAMIGHGETARRRAAQVASYRKTKLRQQLRQAQKKKQDGFPQSRLRDVQATSDQGAQCKSPPRPFLTLHSAIPRGRNAVAVGSAIGPACGHQMNKQVCTFAARMPLRAAGPGGPIR